MGEFEKTIDEVFPGFANAFADNMRKAIRCGAVSEEVAEIYPIWVYRAVLLITANSYQVGSKEYEKFSKNLQHFV